ncbi:MAG TPA: phenylalanine--tRNA ligase subunit beta, partial [Desulfobulbaceae bacterium]|nr:phenylalanine--tRNA ligase subunit beta [Desulfobulbaceae bacterium]
MKFTLSWLSTFVCVDDISPEALAEKLTMLGLEVDAVTPLYQGLDRIVTAKVLSVTKHPNADRLTLCQVDTGEEIVQIVCGAPNVREDMVTALARPGIRLPDGMKIKKAKVRGEKSLGMLCSARELGLSEDHSGIMELDQSLAAGIPLTRALELEDTMIEVDLTPNRPDCASVLGIAREVAGFTGQPLRMPVSEAPMLDSGSTDFSVTIEEPDLCPRYTARKLTNVTIGPSPWWLQRRLLAVGMRPINNIVDITNFVMLEYGQPLHAFDFNKIRDGKIVVRRPDKKETEFETLDGTCRTLQPDMLMICDGKGPVAVAGVMGGLHSEVTDNTTEVLLESACFNPISIRRTARRLNLPSEASYRFERGVDPEIALVAMERAVRLMADIA